MFPSAYSPAIPRNAVSQPIFSPRCGLNGWLLAATAALIVFMLAGLPLMAQTAHFAGAIVTLGSGFSTPTGVTVDGYGNVFVADNGNSAIKEIMAVNGMIPASPVINTLGSGFSHPFTAAVDGSGNVYVADYGNHLVKEIVAVNGSIPASPTIRTLASGLSFIFGTAVDARGDVLFTEYGKNLVKELVAANGTIPASPKTITLGGGFNIPAGVAVDAKGNVFIGDQNNNAVKEILASGGYTTTVTVATGFNTPDGVAVDSNGNVFVANDGANAVNEIVAVNGVIPASPTIVTWGTGFLQPFDVAVDGSGNIYVADRGDNAVKQIQTTGANFSPVNVGTTTLSSIPLTFTFDTAGTLGSIAVVTQGFSGLDFYDGGGGTCTANTAYAAGAVCTVNVKFSPFAAGSRYGAVELLSGTGSLLATGHLQGIGVGAQATYASTTSGVFLPSSVLNVGSGFSGPAGVAMDAAPNIFVADSYNNAVKELTAASSWSTVKTLGSGFNFPNSVAVDGGGNVYVADTFNDAVKEIVAAGGYTTVNTLGSGFSNPYGVAVDGIGDVFVADFANNAVKEILAVDGTIPASPTIRTLASGLNGPDGVAVDANGNVFIAIYGDGTVAELVAVDGSIPSPLPYVEILASGFSGPSNLSVDGIGNVYVSDTGNSAIEEIVLAGGFGGIRTMGYGFNYPEAVIPDEFGDLIVADTDNNAVEFLDYFDLPTLTFASTPVGQTSSDSPQTVTVSNVGNAALILPLPTTGYNPSVSTNFTWDPTSTCAQTSPGSSQAFQLAGGASCTVALDFTPTTAGPLSGSAALTDNNFNEINDVQSITLNGTATGPVLPTLSATSLSFGNVAPGGTSASQSVTLTNPGTTTLPISSIAVTGTNASQFMFSNNCGTSLAPGANCSIHGHFSPTTVGAKTAAITITDSAANSPQSVMLSGTSGAPAVKLSATALSFGPQSVGTNSASQSVTLTNTGDLALSITSITITGTNASSFVFANSCGSSVAAGANCSIHGHFTPTKTGALTAAITITDNATGSPHSVSLSGTGQ